MPTPCPDDDDATPQPAVSVEMDGARAPAELLGAGSAGGAGLIHRPAEVFVMLGGLDHRALCVRPDLCR